MDFGLSGKRALVCGASKGLGLACAQSLAGEGVHVIMVARGPDGLERAARQLRAGGASVATVAADVSTEAGRRAIVDAAGEIDILVNNAGGPPPGNFRDWSREDWMAAFDAGTLSAAFLVRAFVDGMVARRFGRIVNITSIAVKQPQPLLGLSTSARMALTGFVASVAKELVAHGVTVNNLLPGYFETDRLREAMRAWGDQSGRDEASATDERRLAVPARRFGVPAEFGATCAFLCSRHAAYMTGQNILLDGGLYGGTF